MLSGKPPAYAPTMAGDRTCAVEECEAERVAGSSWCADHGPADSKLPSGSPLSRTGTIRLFTAAGLFALLAFGAWTYSAFSSNSASNDPQEAAARYGCHDFVSKQLKAPTTAQFEDPSEGTYAYDDVVGTYTVTGWVGISDSSGATLRTTYTCTIAPAPDSWQLVSLTTSPG